MLENGLYTTEKHFQELQLSSALEERFKNGNKSMMRREVQAAVSVSDCVLVVLSAPPCKSISKGGDWPQTEMAVAHTDLRTFIAHDLPGATVLKSIVYLESLMIGN